MSMIEKNALACPVPVPHEQRTRTCKPPRDGAGAQGDEEAADTEHALAPGPTGGHVTGHQLNQSEPAYRTQGV